jgi:DNA-binding Lrp family transcriptional regulator
MGRKLGVSDTTIRERVERMTTSGLVREGPIMVNEDLLGLSSGVLSCDLESSTPKKQVVVGLSLVDGVYLIQTHLGSLIGIAFYYDGDKSLKRKVDLMSEIAGARSPRFTRIIFPRSSVSLSKTDWRIISAIKRHPKSQEEISEELGISARTVRRRMDSMVEGGAIFAFPSGDHAGIRDGVMADLVMEYESPNTRHKVDGLLLDLLDRYCIFPGIWESYSVYTLILPNVPSSQEILHTVRKVNGIRSARIELVEERHEFHDALCEAIDTRLEALQVVGAAGKFKSGETVRRAWKPQLRREAIL